MANELRVRQNFLGGLVEDNPLTPTATTLTSASLAVMPIIGTTQHMPIILDPDGIFGAPEIAYITAHANTATTATLLRGQEGTTGRQHNRDVPWLHGATVYDVLGDSTWVAPTFQNSWVNYGNGYSVAGYRKDPAGFVHLRGMIMSGVVGSSAFTLPAGYRPAFISTFVSISNAQLGRVDVNPAGTVVPTTPSTNSWVSLEGITFLAEA